MSICLYGTAYQILLVLQVLLLVRDLLEVLILVSFHSVMMFNQLIIGQLLVLLMQPCCPECMFYCVRCYFITVRINE